MDDILNLFAEFAYQVPLVSYHYIQKGSRLVIPYKNYEINALEMFRDGVREYSQRSWQEYDGFCALKNLIINTTNSENPSFAFWASPPGSQEEGYGDYGYFYIAIIPEYSESYDRRITMLALRINDFDSEKVEKSADLLRRLNTDPDVQIPKNATTKDLLLTPIVLPVGKDCSIKTTHDLLSQISTFLEIEFNQKDINDGLTGKVFDRIKNKFQSEIYDIFTALWSLAKGIPLAIDGERLFAALPIDQFTLGSCPSKSETEIQTSDSTKTKDKETHWCPQCGEFFQGLQCGCGYRIG